MSELLLKNCSIYEDEKTLQKDILIKNGIIHLISNSINRENVPTIDCCKKLILPGMIDSHLHIPGNLIYKSNGVYLNDCKSIKEYIECLQKYANENPGKKVVLGSGWFDDIMYNSSEYKNGINFAKLIDSVFPSTPVVLYSMDFHSAWCNTTALEIMEITSDTHTDNNGKIEFDKDGSVSGLLRGNATDYIKRKEEIFSFSEEEFELAFKEYQKMLLSFGITSVNTFMFIGINAQKAWNVLKRLEANQELIININGYVPATPGDIPELILEKFNQMQSLNSKKIRINTVKIYIDGVVENKTAFLKKPYENSGKYVGCSYWEKNSLVKLFTLLNKNSIQIHAHTIGDAAVKLFLDALKESENKSLHNDPRHVATHIQLIDLNDMDDFKKMKVLACVQPFWINDNLNEKSFDYIMLGERSKSQYRINSFIREGIVLTSSSDSPVTERPSPFVAIDKAINRNDNERSDIVDMIDSYTVNGAYQLKREREIGYVGTGMNADLILVSKNLYDKNIDNIKNTKVLLTIVDGEIVYNCLQDPEE